MIAVTSRIDTAEARAMLERLREGLKPEALDDLVEDVAMQVLAEIVALTPKKWFGQVRRSWQVERPEAARRLIINENKIMGWLEEGTAAHGPVRASSLFIPLTRRAALAYAARRVSTLTYGVDYVLVKWVRGIRARHIVRDYIPRAQELLLTAIEQRVRELVNG